MVHDSVAHICLVEQLSEQEATTKFHYFTLQRYFVALFEPTVAIRPHIKELFANIH
jgi:hypothetical protein